MRFWLAILLFATLAAAAQTEESVYVGLVTDARFIQLRGEEGIVNRRPSWGWGLGLTGMYNATPTISVFGSIMPISQEMIKIEYSDGSGTLESAVAGTELATTVLFRPVRKSKYSMVTGAGLSMRRIWNDGIDGYTKAWNYRLPLQAGVELPAGKKCKIMLLAEYQFGLRKMYLNYFRTDTFGLKFIAMWPKPQD